MLRIYGLFSRYLIPMDEATNDPRRAIINDDETLDEYVPGNYATEHEQTGPSLLVDRNKSAKCVICFRYFSPQ